MEMFLLQQLEFFSLWRLSLQPADQEGVVLAAFRSWSDSSENQRVVLNNSGSKLNSVASRIQRNNWSMMKRIGAVARTHGRTSPCHRSSCVAAPLAPTQLCDSRCVCKPSGYGSRLLEGSLIRSLAVF